MLVWCAADAGAAPEKARANKRLDFNLLEANQSQPNAAPRVDVTPRSALMLTTGAAGQWRGLSLEDLRRQVRHPSPSRAVPT